MLSKPKGRSRLSKALPAIPPALDPLPFEPLSPSFDTPTPRPNTALDLGVNANTRPGAAAIPSSPFISSTLSSVPHTSGLSQTRSPTQLSRTLLASNADATLASSSLSTPSISDNAPPPSPNKSTKLSSFATMKFLPSVPKKSVKSLKEKTSFAKLFPLRSSSKKAAAPQPPPMSIPRRPVPIAKTPLSPPIKSPNQLSQNKARVQSQNQSQNQSQVKSQSQSQTSSSAPSTIARQQAASSSHTNTNTTPTLKLQDPTVSLEAPLSTSVHRTLDPQVQVTKAEPLVTIPSLVHPENQLQLPQQSTQATTQRLSDASRLSTILNAYSRNSEDHTEGMGFFNVFTSTISGSKAPAPASTTSTPASGGAPAIKNEEPTSASQAPSTQSVAEDHFEYDYSVYTQYSNDDSKTPKQQFSASSSSLQVPGANGLPKTPKSGSSGMYLHSTATDSTTSNITSERPVSLMSDIISSYSSQPSTPVSTDSGSAANSVSASKSNPTGPNSYLNNNNQSTASNLSPANPNTTSSLASLSSNSNNQSDYQLWRRRSVKNDRSIQVANLALNPSAGSSSVSSSVSASNVPTTAVTGNPNPVDVSQQSTYAQTSSQSQSGSILGGNSGLKVRPVSKLLPPPPPNQSSPIVSPSDSVYSQDSSSMGQSGSKLRSKAQEKIVSTRDEASHKRLPTPDYEREDIKTPVIEEIMSPLPMSPASSPKENKMQSEVAAAPTTITQVAMPSTTIATASTDSSTMSPQTTKQPIVRKAIGQPIPSKQTASVSAPIPSPTESIMRNQTSTPVSRPGGPPMNFHPQQPAGSHQISMAGPRLMNGSMYGPAQAHLRRPSQARSIQGSQPMSATRPSSTVYKDIDYDALPSPPAQALYFPKQMGVTIAIGTPIQAPKLKPSHFNCMHQHQRMIRVSNRNHPLTCQACENAETEDFQRCHWCALRICMPCANTLRTCRGDLALTLERTKNPMSSQNGSSTSASTPQGWAMSRNTSDPGVQGQMTVVT